MMWFVNILNVLWGFLNDGVMWFVNVFNMMGSSRPSWGGWVMTSWVGSFIMMDILFVLVDNSLIFLLGTAMSHLSDPSSALFFERSFFDRFSLDS